MNIFWLDKDIRTCAQYHNDKHCVKMILEYAQLLSTAHRVLDGKEVVVTNPAGKKRKHLQLPDKMSDQLFYKATHINHPCAVWVRQSRANYATLHHLLQELLYEYSVRYGKTHKTERLLFALSTPPKRLSAWDHTEAPLCMPDQFKVPGDVVESYRNYYRRGKSHIANWRVRNTPVWF